MRIEEILFRFDYDPSVPRAHCNDVLIDNEVFEWCEWITYPDDAQ